MALSGNPPYYISVLNPPSPLTPAKGDGVTDDTASLQAIINYATNNGYSVYIPNGTYLVNAVTGLNIPQYGNVLLQDKAVLKAIPSSSSGYRIIVMASHTSLEGGTIRGERAQHTGSGDFQGHGITIWDATDVKVGNIKIYDCRGDGIYIGGTSNLTKNVCLSCIYCENNARNGISIISGDGISISNATLVHQNGSQTPMGLDIEPNEGNTIGSIFISDLLTKNNEYFGFSFYNQMQSVKLQDINISVNGLVSVDDNGGCYIAGILDRSKACNVMIADYSYSGKNTGIYMTNIGASCNIMINGNIHTNGVADITGSITSGSNKLTVSDASKLYSNSYLTISGVAGAKKIVSISGNIVTLDSNANATVTNAPVTRYTAAIRAGSATVTGTPNIVLNINVSGVYGDAFNWFSNSPSDINFSKGIRAFINNTGSPTREINLYGLNNAPSIQAAHVPVNSYFHYSSNYFYQNVTQQGNVLFNNAGATADCNYNIQNTYFIDGAVVYFESAVAGKALNIVLSDSTKIIKPYGSYRITSKQAGARIRMQRDSSGNWQAIEVIGTWAAY